MIVRETLVNEQNKLNLSAGLVIIQDQKILLAHPTGAKWEHSYSIPKGHVERGELLIETAIRETKEEVGIEIDPKDIDKTEHFVDYNDKKGKLYKRVYYFIARPSQKISKKDLKLQKEEVDWAGFLDKEEAKKRIFWRLKTILNHLV